MNILNNRDINIGEFEWEYYEVLRDIYQNTIYDNDTFHQFTNININDLHNYIVEL